MSTYVVGDIQGCLKPLKQLLKQVGFTANSDQLWCVGDLVNRGPKSLDTLRFLQDLGDSCTAVLGNHDLHLLAIARGCSPARNKDTLGKLLSAPDCAVLCEWLRHKPLVHYENVVSTQGNSRGSSSNSGMPTNFLMVHAGIAPQWSLNKTLTLAAEVELALQGPDPEDFFKAMYGNEPNFWSDTLKGSTRLRVITNYLTRLRFCDEIGTMDLSNKKGLEQTPLGYGPWFQFEKLTPNTHILFGHWASLEGKTNNPYIQALDTGYVWGRQLTLLRLEDFKRFAVSA